jgi:sugar O-acyltransferase (sialic acid O-acetyltransferase NeuD family)
MTSPDQCPLVIVGAGGHARVVLDIARLSSRPVGAFVDAELRSSSVDDIPVVQNIGALAHGAQSYDYVVAIGDNFVRSRVSESLTVELPGIRFATLVHPCATVATNCVLGEGTVVMGGVIVNPGSRIGKHCILNTRASIDHDNAIADFASLAPGSVTGGNVRIGKCSAISLGASVIHGITIGKHSIVGAGAVVLRDVPDFSVVVGVPARLLKRRTADEPYL